MISTFSDRTRNGKREMEGGGVKRGGIKKTAYRKLHHCVSLDLDCLLNHTATTQRFCFFGFVLCFCFLPFCFLKQGFFSGCPVTHSIHQAALEVEDLISTSWVLGEGVHHTPGFSPILSLQTQFITFFFFLFQRMFGSDHVLFFFFSLEKDCFSDRKIKHIDKCSKSDINDRPLGLPLPVLKAWCFES